MPTLLGVLFEARQVQCVGLGRVEPSFRPSATVVVLADEDLVGEENHVLARRRLHLEGDLGEQVALVEAVEVDLEGAAHVRFVVGMVVERHVVDLDGAVVPRRVRCRRRTGAAEDRGQNDPGHRREHPPDG